MLSVAVGIISKIINDYPEMMCEVNDALRLTDKDGIYKHTLNMVGLYIVDVLGLIQKAQGTWATDRAIERLNDACDLIEATFEETET